MTTTYTNTQAAIAEAVNFYGMELSNMTAEEYVICFDCDYSEAEKAEVIRAFNDYFSIN